jgi:hypothetical protein
MKESPNWQLSLNDFKNSYSSVFPSCIMVGSLVYGARFKPTSDIDLLIEIDGVDGWKKACNLFLDMSCDNPFVITTLKKYEEKKGEYFCLKFSYKGIDYSVDFFNKSFVLRMIDDLSKIDNVVYYKITNKPQTNEYIMRCGDSEIFTPKENQHHENNVVGVSSPLFYADISNFYWGIMLNKLLTGYYSIWSNNEFSEGIEQLCAKGISRMLSVPKVGGIEKVFENLARYEKLPKEHIENQKNYYKNLLNL